ncbi:UNKNOWN [Stylonychia lemnae]|uniref:Uncharacterized protein n=1 Tax=Stylonychia lemnae TaxID=5949 RepID=A0A077ZSI8_STYLE|nr:UNKNOWN [Stylonychia lemnae]|eukprot:CDW71441.1 UNKNOWN [Stylonychia lemnae]
MICIEYFFPKQPANMDVEQARKLRKGVIPLVVGHVIIACLGMAFVSILTFAAQFFYIALLYSIYMTLRPWLVWFYMVILGFNIASGLFTVFLYDGASFAVYLLILVVYVFFILKIKTDSHDFRNMTVQEHGSHFYLEDGIRHMYNTARQEYQPLRSGGSGQPDNFRAHGQPVFVHNSNPSGRNSRLVDDNEDASYGEPLLQNHYLNQMRAQQNQNNNANRLPYQNNQQQNQPGANAMALGMPLIRALGAHIQQQFQAQQQNQAPQVQQNQGQGRVNMMDRIYDEEQEHFRNNRNR